MRLSNRSKIPKYNFVNTVLFMMLVGGVMGFFLERYKFNILGIESYLLIIIPIIIIAVFFFRGRQVFEYDSDGEALNFKNRNIVPFVDQPLSDEFPKYKLIRYEIVSMFLIKRLYVTISSKNNGSTMLKYEISYLTRMEINDLRLSLNKVVKANSEKKVLSVDDNRRILA
ncbi:hypothetical protein [Chryseobacterium sp.]|uniref:hypothetical protein n=1 Tax=Chryseobacterium sp. TaxID=1871047 RepID=UPI0025C24646|nr:hypothetical protein [Chryseobacterium sp.]